MTCYNYHSFNYPVHSVKEMLSLMLCFSAKARETDVFLRLLRKIEESNVMYLYDIQYIIFNDYNKYGSLRELV